MHDFGVAISVYNKVAEVETNVNLIRKHWKQLNDAFISVCCNDMRCGSYERLSDLLAAGKIDSLVMGDDIPSTPKPSLRCRQFDCITKSVSACKGKAKHVMHIHADAYATDAAPIAAILAGMKARDAAIAYRGRGYEKRNNKTIYGDIDDHFVFFDMERLSACPEFFECPASELLKTCNVESLLARQASAHFHDALWYYSDMRGNVVDPSAKPAEGDDTYGDGIQHRAMKPFNHDTERHFFHASDRDLVRKFLLSQGVDECLIAFVAKEVVVFDCKPSGDADLDDWMKS